MAGESIQRQVTITNPHGLHLRPIQSFVELAGQFQSLVWVHKEGKERVNGKSALGLLGLAAEPGSQLTIEVQGPDQEAALNALAELLANYRTDEET